MTLSKDGVMRTLELLYKGNDTHDSGNDRNDYEGMKMGMIGTICGCDWNDWGRGHDWNDFCGAAFEGTMGMITVFVMPVLRQKDRFLSIF